MVRTHILLTETQARELRKRSAAEGRSMTDLVRDGVDVILGERGDRCRIDAKTRALSAVGRFRSGVRDLGSRHDEHLDEAWKP
jgi:hypothetical protein